MDVVPRAEHLARYLKSDTATLLAGWDERGPAAEPSRIDLYCIVGWRDVTRAVMATQIIDREMRRGARAYRDAFGSGDSADSLFTSPEWLLRHLAAFPLPLHANQSGLEMVELCGPPLSFHMVPTEDAQRVLAKAPASQVGYTMAAFGRPFAISQIQGRNHRQPDLPLSRVLDLVSPTSAPFDVLSKEDHRADDLLMTDFRSVSKPSKRDHLGFEVHLIVRRLCNDAIDLIHAWY